GKLAVEVGGAGDAGLRGRSGPLVGNRVARADLGNVDRSALPAPGVATALVVLEPAEIRQHARVVPPGRAEFGPVVVVPLVSANEHHPVDRAAAAEPLACRPDVGPSAQDR